MLDMQFFYLTFALYMLMRGDFYFTRNPRHWDWCRIINNLMILGQVFSRAELGVES